MKKGYIGKATYNRMIKFLNLKELKVFQELENKNNKTVLEVEILGKSSLNTSLNHYIYNNKKGKFFISDGINDNNEIKITKVIKNFWGIDDNQLLSEYKRKWISYYNDDDIKLIKIYNKLSEIYDKSHSHCGSIGGSCMRGKGEYYDWLDADENVKIAYIEKDGELIGRAILWYGVICEYDDGEKGELKKIKINFMDRIYAENDVIEEIFKKWAKVNKFYMRKGQSCCDKDDIISPNGKLLKGCKLYFKLQKPLQGNELAPYLDTFSYLEDNLQVLNNYCGKYVLTYTDGRGIQEYCECWYCGNEFFEDDGREVDGYGFVCESCLDEYFRWCVDIDDYRYYEDCFYCESDGNYYASDDELVYIEGYGYALIEDCNECKYCGNWDLVDEFKTILDRRGVIIEICNSCYYVGLEDGDLISVENISYSDLDDFTVKYLEDVEAVDISLLTFNEDDEMYYFTDEAKKLLS